MRKLIYKFKSMFDIDRIYVVLFVLIAIRITGSSLHPRKWPYILIVFLICLGAFHKIKLHIKSKMRYNY